VNVLYQTPPVPPEARDGRSAARDGLTTPKELGGPGGDSLFAAGLCSLHPWRWIGDFRGIPRASLDRDPAGLPPAGSAASVAALKAARKIDLHYIICKRRDGGAGLV